MGPRGGYARSTSTRAGWSHFDPNVDPWDTVDDLDGREHYRVLGIDERCGGEEIKAAYRAMAREHHPDKGGDAARFAAVKRAFDVLSDPEARKTYDAWAGVLKYRYIPGVTNRVDGGEDLLLDEFERMGMTCIDANTQLVVLCEVCGRPSTKQCWTCGMMFCDFCTRKQHWKGKYPLHWPLVNTPGKMIEELGKRELEQKKIEDAKKFLLEDPNYRNETELDHIRDFKRAAYEIQKLNSKDRQQKFDLRLGKYYMWAQTDHFVYLVVYVPNGFENKTLHFEPTPTSFLLQAEDSPPIIDRVVNEHISSEQSIESYSTKDNRFFTVSIPKGQPGREWKSLFLGDDDGIRCLKQPYIMTETEEEVILEFELPFWIDKDDCKVEIGTEKLVVKVRGEVNVCRTYWRDLEQEQKGNYVGPVDISNSMWSLDDEIAGNGERVKVLMINIARPPPTEEEMKWKKGVRQSNLVKEHKGHHNRRGVRFFVEDQDLFDLENLLVALCFMETNKSWVPFKPWERAGNDGIVATSIDMLSSESKSVIERLLEGYDNAESD